MRKYIQTFVLIVAGGISVAIGVQFFLVPNNLVTGGISGLAIILRYFTGWPTGVLIFAINAPIFLFAFRQLGLAFLLTALAGVLTKSILVDVFAMFEFVPTQSLIVAAFGSGLFIGLGVVLFFRAGSCSGGVDLLARLILMKRPDWTLGRAIFLIDAAIILAGALVFRQIELALYAVVAVFTLKWVIDAVLKRVDQGEPTK